MFQSKNNKTKDTIKFLVLTKQKTQNAQVEEMKVWIESIKGMNVNHNIWDKT